MKKLLFFSFFLLLITTPTLHGQGTNSEDQWSRVNLGINPAGFLLLGPSVDVGLRVGTKTYTGLYYMNHKLGMMAGDLIFDNTISSYSPKSMGGGVFFRHYMKPNAKLNAWFIGLSAGYSYNEASYHEGNPVNEKVEKVDNIPIFASGGYRWNLGKHVYLNAGLQLGVAIAAKDKIYWVYQYNSGLGDYEEKLTEFDDYSGEVFPFINPELSIGIKF